MSSQVNINTRILKEVEKANIDKEHREFLKDILNIELDNIDKERPRFTEEYKKVFYQRFGV